MEDELDLEALKKAALATIKKAKQDDAKHSAVANSYKSLDDLAGLRAAALLSKANRPDSSTGSGDYNSTVVKPAKQIEAATSDLGASKFSRPKSILESDADDGSEFSILEEIEQGNIIESDENNTNASISTSEIPLPDDSEERAIPELLEDSVDITEFDDDDLILEDIPMPSAKAKQSDQSQVLDRRKEKHEPVNGITGSSRNNSEHKRLSALSRIRSRSRSPRLRRSRSPRLKRSPSPHLRRARSPPQQYRSTTPPHRYRSPKKNPHMTKVDYRSGSSNRQRGSGDHHKDYKLSPQILSFQDEDKVDVVETSVVPDPLENPLLTEEEKETLLNRKNKFIKVKKVSSTKKTIKLKKTKKKSSITKRLGAKKPKVEKVKSVTPEIVETVALETEALPSKEVATSTKVTKKRIKDRLGGYRDSKTEAVPAKKKRRTVSVEQSSSAASVHTEEFTTKSESTTESFDYHSSDFSDSEARSSSSKTKSITITNKSDTSIAASNNGSNKMTAHKRNIWSSRSSTRDIEDSRLSRSRESIHKGQGVVDERGRSHSPVEENDANSFTMSKNTHNHIQKVSAHRKNAWSSRLAAKVYGGDDDDMSRRVPRDRELDCSKRSENRRDSTLEDEPKARTSQTAWSSIKRVESWSTKADSKGKSRKEQELDERIRKIKEQNAKLEERQKEIEKEKLLYG